MVKYKNINGRTLRYEMGIRHGFPRRGSFVTMSVRETIPSYLRRMWRMLVQRPDIGATIALIVLLVGFILRNPILTITGSLASILFIMDVIDSALKGINSA